MRDATPHGPLQRLPSKETIDQPRGKRVAAANATRSRPFPLPAKKSIIASRLGLTPEYFSRMLHDLITARAIVVEGRQITILDPALLRGAGHTDAVAA